MKVWKKNGFYNLLENDPCLNFLAEQINQKTLNEKGFYREIS